MFGYAMIGARSRKHVGTAAAVGVSWLLAAACSGSSGSTGPNTGSLTITITAPAGVTPSVAVSGPGGYHQTLSATQTLSGLTVGGYTVTAATVRGTNAIVATVYTATVTGGAATVGAGATAMASVSYAAQPGSGALWVSNAKVVLAYTATQLAATTSAAPATALGTCPCTNNAVAIDATGNLWVGGSDGVSTVVEYTAGELAKSGSPTPAVTLSAKAGSLNGPTGLAFDGGGNLWVANFVNNTLVEFTTSQLTATGSPAPAVTLGDNGAGSLNGPEGLAFDRSGTLWVINYGNSTVVAYSPSQLAASGSPTPAVTLSADGSGSINKPLGVAFDAGGDLWVANAGPANTVVGFTSSQLVSSGSPTPAVTLSSTVGGLSGPWGLAFDNGGNLWVANNAAGTVVGFAASQLAASGAPPANVTVSGSSLTVPTGLAFDPHAASLPLK